MSKWRKKPVVIEAFKFDNNRFDESEASYMPDWAQNAYRDGVLFLDVETPASSVELFVKTLEGNMRVSNGDYIIQGVNGELYPCKPDIFAKTYEPAESEEGHA